MNSRQSENNILYHLFNLIFIINYVNISAKNILFKKYIYEPILIKLYGNISIYSYSIVDINFNKAVGL